MATFNVKLFNGGDFERNGRIIPEDVFKKAVDEYIEKLTSTKTIIGEIKHIERDNNFVKIEVDENQSLR